MQYKLMGYGVELHSVQQDDIELLRNWRNREDIRSMMKSTHYITKEQQQSWFESLEEATHVRHFLISYKGQAIGSSTLTGVSFVAGFTDDLENASEIEPGLYMGDEKYKNNILAFAPSLVMCDFCFEELQVNKLIATVNSENKQALSYNNRLGYKEETRFFTEAPFAPRNDGLFSSTNGLKNNGLANDASATEALSTDASARSGRQEWIRLSLSHKDYLAASKQIKHFLSRR